MIQVLKESQAKLGPDHTETLTRMNNLAGLYNERGQPRPRHTLPQATAGGPAAKIGSEHPDTLVTMHNLGWTYRDVGRCELAEPLLLEAVAGLRKKLGFTHDLTQTAIHNLADLRRMQVSRSLPKRYAGNRRFSS